MALNTNIYGFVIDPLFSFCDQGGKTIANGYVRVFLAGTSTPVLTYRNYDGALNAETIELDNSGRTMTQVIASKGDLYKVCVYDAEHSQEDPILTVDKIAVLGSSINASGATIVTGLDSVTVPEENFLKATVEGTGVELALDPTEVTSEVSTTADAVTAGPDYVAPLLDKTGTGDGKKISLANLFKFALDWISRLATTVTSFASGDFIAVSNTTNGSRKMSKDTLLELTAQNALAGNVAPAFDPTKPNDAGGYAYYKDEIVAYNGATYKFKVNHSSGSWNPAEVERCVAGESLKFFVVTDNPDYLYAITDKDNRFLLGIKTDGSVEWAKGIPNIVKNAIERKVDKIEGKSLVDEVYASSLRTIQNQDYLFSVVDADDVLLFGIRTDGSIVWSKGVPGPLYSAFQEKRSGQSTVDEVYTDVLKSLNSYEDKIDLKTDQSDKILEYITSEGFKVFLSKVMFKGGVDWDKNVLSDLEIALRNKGYSGGSGDWSAWDEIVLPKPKCAIVNFSGLTSFPLTKGSDVECQFEMWDGHGNYFKKPVIINPQGNSTLQWPKKNIAVDLFSDIAADKSCKVKFGDWLEFDSYHLKAYYNDFYKCIGCISYDLIDEMWKTRGPLEDAPWKKALIDQANYPEGRLMFGGETDYSLRLDTGALCHPMGFPCLVFLNGAFYGVYAFQIKKDRKNYHQTKSNTKHIHLDGVLGNGNLWGQNGDIDWDEFEVRNPKDLIDMDGNKYDGDDPKELIDSSSPAWTGSSKQVKTQQVKNYIIAASEIAGHLTDAVSQYGVNSSEFKAVFETYYDVDNIIDWAIFIDFWFNLDGIMNNTQWITYDGVKWWATPYDIDIAFGWYSPYVENNIGHPLARDILYLPIKYIFDNDEYAARAYARYKYLRDSGILSLDNVFRKISDFTQSVGMDYYEKEYEKWPGISSDIDSEVDTEYWELDLDINGKPVYGSKTWSAETAYSVGDKCFYGHNEEMGYVRFTSVKNGAGHPPIKKFGIRDSIWRLCSWMKRHIGYCDINYNYNQE